MKKIWFLCIMFLTCILTGCSSSYTRDTSSGELHEISLVQMQEKMKNGDEFVVAFTHSLCRDCQKFLAIFESYRKDHRVIIYEIDLSKEELDESLNRSMIQQYFPTFDATPGIYYAKGGHVVTSLTDGQSKMSEEILDNWVQKNKLDEKK